MSIINRKKINNSDTKSPKTVFVLSFLVPFLAMLLVFIVKQIYPFGNIMFLRTDLYHQYAPFLSEFMDKLKNGGSLLYSWNIGGGSNFTALYAYYLSSPFNWILLLFPRSLLIEFISYMTIIKMGLCGLTFSIFLSGHSGTRSHRIMYFSWAYAMSAYLAAYSWNIMWLDCIILAPLVMLGIEKLVKQGKPFMYCITLALTIIMNFYIAIMVCIFCVIYFVICMVLLPRWNSREIVDEEGNTFTEREKIKNSYFKKLIMFGVFSLIAGGLSGVLLLPTMYALQLTHSAGSAFPSTLSIYFSAQEVVARHCVGVTTEQALDHWPNIYCGAFVLLLIPAYYLCRKISLKAKIVYGAFILFMLLSFSTNILNYIWHGMHYPNSLPARQSFLYIAILLMMAYEATEHLKEMSHRALIISTAAPVVFVLAGFSFINLDETNSLAFLATGGLIIIYAFMAFAEMHDLFPRSVRMGVVSFVLIAELIVNMIITSIPSNTRSSYLNYYDDYQAMIELAEEDNDNVFYRMDKDQRARLTRNDSAWLGFSGLSVFSSTSSDGVGELYTLLGVDHSTNAYCMNGSTPVIQALLGQRYLLSRDANLAGDGIYTLVGNSGDIYLYRNDLSTELGFFIPDSSMNSIYFDGYSDPISRQSELIEGLTGVDDLFTELPESTQTENGFFVSEAGHVYLYSNDSAVDNLNATVGDESRTFSHVRRGYLMDLGYCESGTQISLSSSDSEILNCTAVTVNANAYARAMNALSSAPFTLTEHEDTYFSGTITAPYSGKLLVAVPYDPGWTITVDGSVVRPELYQDAYYLISLSAGEHTIEFTYHVKGLTEGAAISAVSLLILAGLVYFNTRKKRKLSLEETP